jgi:hypothetical protein
MSRSRIRIRIHRNGAYAQTAAGADDSAGDFATVGNEDGRNHRKRETKKFNFLEKLNFCLRYAGAMNE